VRCREGDTIFNVGDESTHFYMIDRGTVHVLIDSNLGIHNSNEGRIVALSRGDCFGETALMKPSGTPKRGATVIAASECTLLVLASHHFWDVMADETLAHKAIPAIEMDLEKVQKYRPFLRDSLSRSSLFNRLRDEQIQALAVTIKEERVYKKDDVIFRQGDEDTSLYIVKEGQVKLAKHTQGKTNSLTF